MENFASLNVWSAIFTDPSVINLAVIEIFNKNRIQTQKNQKSITANFLLCVSATATVVDTAVVTHKQTRKKKSVIWVTEWEQ